MPLMTTYFFVGWMICRQETTPSVCARLERFASLDVTYEKRHGSPTAWGGPGHIYLHAAGRDHGQ
jgi:hypothetical protein